MYETDHCMHHGRQKHGHKHGTHAAPCWWHAEDAALECAAGHAGFSAEAGTACCAGYHLNFAKMTATWGEHEPAYYVATHPEKREVVAAIRGTWAVEDVVTDITALPVVPAHPLTPS